MEPDNITKHNSNNTSYQKQKDTTFRLLAVIETDNSKEIYKTSWNVSISVHNPTPQIPMPVAQERDWNRDKNLRKGKPRMINETTAKITKIWGNKASAW